MKKRLEGINALLKTIGEVPLLSESDFALSYEAQQAEAQIDYTLDEVLSEGFKFNTLDMDLKPDSDGYISVPPNALVMEFEDSDLTINDGLVFNKVDFTRKFTEPVAVNVVYREDFDYIPIVIQNFIIAKASVEFQRDNINDDGVNQGLEKSYKEKLMKLNVFKIKQAKANGKDSRFERNTNPVAT